MSQSEFDWPRLFAHLEQWRAREQQQLAAQAQQLREVLSPAPTPEAVKAREAKP